jgi:PKHD-type hydroxylase
MKHVNQFTWGSIFSEEECDTICSTASDYTRGKGQVLTNGTGGIKDLLARNCELAWIPNSTNTAWMYMRINEFVQAVNEQWLNFELDGRMEALQYLEYGFGQFYGWHQDNGSDAVATRKLTAVIQLSDPSDYIGGSTKIDSQTFTENGKFVDRAPKARGSITIFPSHLRHFATPVFWGRRKALVAWFHGSRPLR